MPAENLTDGRIFPVFLTRQFCQVHNFSYRPPRMKVSFRTLDGRKYTLTLDSSTTVAEAKQKLAEQLAWGAAEITFLFQRHEVKDETTIRELEIDPTSCICVFKRMPTAKFPPPPDPAPAPDPTPAPEPEQPPEPDEPPEPEKPPELTKVCPRPEEPSVQPLPGLSREPPPSLPHTDLLTRVIFMQPTVPREILGPFEEESDPEQEHLIMIEHENPLAEQERNLTDEQRETIANLVEALSMDKMTVLQVFIACNNDVNLTANALLSMKNSEQ